MILTRNETCLARNETRLASNKTRVTSNETRGGNLFSGGTIQSCTCKCAPYFTCASVKTSDYRKTKLTTSSHQEHGGSVFCIQAPHDFSIVVQSGTPAIFKGIKICQLTSSRQGRLTIVNKVTVKASVSGHPREAGQVSATGADRSWECANIQ